MQLHRLRGHRRLHTVEHGRDRAGEVVLESQAATPAAWRPSRRDDSHRGPRRECFSMSEMRRRPLHAAQGSPLQARTHAQMHGLLRKAATRICRCPTRSSEYIREGLAEETTCFEDPRRDGGRGCSEGGRRLSAQTSPSKCPTHRTPMAPRTDCSGEKCSRCARDARRAVAVRLGIVRSDPRVAWFGNQRDCAACILVDPRGLGHLPGEIEASTKAGKCRLADPMRTLPWIDWLDVLVRA